MQVRFQHRRYRLPLRIPVRTAHGVMTEREGLIVRVEDKNGIVGYGEAAPLAGFGSETTEQDDAACHGFGEWGDVARLTALPEGLDCLENALRSATEIIKAVSGTASEQTSRPANALDPSVTEPEYLSVAAFLPAGPAAIPSIAPKADAGFRVFKWKVGVGDVADELSLLDDVCAELPEGAKLRLDANGAWERRHAERWLERCAERPVEFIEQPISPSARGADDILRGLGSDYPTPIALDESVVRDGDVERWLGFGWRGVFVLKPSLIADSRRALTRLEAAHADVVFSSALETAIGGKTALRAAFAWRGKRRAIGFGVWPLFVDHRFNGPHAVPFLRREDVERIDAEQIWNALS